MRASLAVAFALGLAGCDGDTFERPPDPDLAGKPPFDLSVNGREASVPDLAGTIDLGGLDLSAMTDLSIATDHDLSMTPDLRSTTADGG